VRKIVTPLRGYHWIPPVPRGFAPLHPWLFELRRSAAVCRGIPAAPGDTELFGGDGRLMRKAAVVTKFVIAGRAIRNKFELTMRLYPISFLFATALAVASWASGSEEEFVIWKQVKITSSNSQTGDLVFEAKTDGDTYSAVSFSVFGKQFKLEEPQLSKLKGFPLSSLSLTHEAGYAELGGHTVHFKLTRHYYDSKSEKTVQERIVISISKGKGLEIHGPEKKELEPPPAAKR
jgi:hypothetical protein